MFEVIVKILGINCQVVIIALNFIRRCWVLMNELPDLQKGHSSESSLVVWPLTIRKVHIIEA